MIILKLCLRLLTCNLHSVWQLNIVNRNLSFKDFLITTFGEKVFSNFNDVTGCDLMLMRIIYNAKWPGDK